MVASGVASKGLDFSEIQHVINFTMPKEIEVSFRLLPTPSSRPVIDVEYGCYRTTSIKSDVLVVQARRVLRLLSSTCKLLNKPYSISSIC